ncbi:MAG: zinc metalloprotease HtpX [Candidatus Micrarchaeota archaeon]
MVYERGIEKLNLALLVTTALVFGAVAGILAVILWLSGASGFLGIGTVLIFSLILLAVQWYIGPILVKWITHAQEVKPNEMLELRGTLTRLARSAGIPTPKLYVVNNSSPNAFAFGRTQGSSCIAVHTGLLERLEQDEIEAVLAHEVAHIKHRDVIIMTLASVLPVLLYFLVIVFGSGNSRERSGSSAIFVFIGAIFARILGTLLVLYLSRVREYNADAYSAYATRNPLALMRALAKISYAVPAVQQARGAQAQNETMRAFYIANPSTSEKLRMANIVSALNTGNDEKIRDVIEKEKKNGAFELIMTHPLTAKRLDALYNIKRELNQ